MFRQIASLGQLLGVASVAALTLLVVGEVVARSLFDHSFEFMEEVSGYLLVAITFLAAADSFASGSFMRVDVIYGRLSPGTQRRLDRALAVLASLLCAVIAWYLVKLVWSSFHNGVVSPGRFAVPLWIPQLAMVIGVVLLAVACIRHAVNPATDAPDAPALDRLQD